MAWALIVCSGWDAVRRHPLRNAVTAACVVAMLLPYVVGVAIARGLADQVVDSVASGADVYVGGEQAGVVAPLTQSVWETIAQLPGVRSVTPRIVAPIALGARNESVVLVGLPHSALPRASRIVRGRMIGPGAENEAVIGTVVARELGLDVGAMIPPFYRSSAGERLTTVVGVFHPDAPVWQARLLLTSFDTASRIIDRPGTATDLLVETDGSELEDVALAIRNLRALDRGGTEVRLRVQTRTDVSVLGLRDVVQDESLFHALFALVFATGIPIVLVSSGVGLSERRRETGLLRATGWRVDEVLLRTVSESLTVATVAGGTAVALAWGWLRVLHGWGIAPVFFRGEDPTAGFGIPFRLAPLPILLGFAFAYILVLIGSLPATWRAASIPPASAMS